MMMGFLRFLLVLTFTGVCAATNPGVKVRLTKRGIEFANKVAHDEIVKQLQTLSIPGQSGSSGHISYDFNNIQVKGVTPPGSAIVLVPGKSGLTWSLSNFGISIRADWRVKYKKGFIKISDHGSVDVGMSGVNVAETASFGIDKTGRPSISSGGCSDSVGKADIKFHGGSAKILNLFRGIFEDKIKKLLQSKICDQVQKFINQDAERSLANMKITQELAKKFLLDYRLVGAPSVTADYLEILDKGAIYWEADPKESPFTPAPIPPLADNSRMVYIWVTTYTPNTFFYQAHTHGYLKYNVTKKDLPPDQEGFLNTTCSLKCIGTIIPQIGKAYPNSTVELRVQTSRVPNTNATSSAVKAELDTFVEMWAHTPDNRVVYLLTLAVNTSLTVNASIKNDKLIGKITDHSFKLSIIKSDVGKLNPTVFNIIIDGALMFAVIPKLNDIAAKGVDLPMVQGVQFINSNLVLQEGNVLIGTDITFSGRK